MSLSSPLYFKVHFIINKTSVAISLAVLIRLQLGALWLEICCIFATEVNKLRELNGL